MTAFDPHAEAEAVEQPLYAPRRKIHPQSVRGTFRRIKWALLVVTLGIYYLLPFVRWDRGPNEPSQAVLVDLVHRRFYFFFIEIWPQEVYYFTGLLVLAAMILFLMNAVAGRMWCGYLCPQTVWTDLFLATERWVEGDRREQMRRDAAPWTADRIRKKVLKHALWLMIAWWTGGAWVLYFSDAPTLMRDLATLQAPFVAYAWIGILTFTTYVLAGHMREQVCLYMCPWPRIQAALTDEHALNVTYRHDRGEPRMSVKKAAALRTMGSPAGDCIDCGQCVAVCPTGVDIRGGANLGCIQCGLCIDACDGVMAKIGRSPRLIAYDTDINIARREAGKSNVYRVIRPRTALYAAVIAIVAGTMLWTLGTRGNLGISAIHDRNPLAVRTADGSIRNGYAIRILNRKTVARRFKLDAQGAFETRADVVGIARGPDGTSIIQVGPDQTSEVRVLLTATPDPHSALDGAAAAQPRTLTFRVVDVQSGDVATTQDHFFFAP